ncbi:cellulose synthase subunit BcsC [Bremerella volcania]|uniref:Cellulose synthase subunit BcsC n=1 Tax=Bremerella volcania TaxID=2527984 RepID=A0A518C664_9BACT|nr:tetratricopeptide repeat protein [Bremerella volcania]QDU74726.1 cellulose synthase subunit BcsC [Bremerella volcania]
MILRPSSWMLPLFAALVLGSVIPRSLAAAESSSAEEVVASNRGKDELPFSQLPEPLIEKTPRNESAENRLQLTTLLTKARLQDHRGDVAGALETYQRAYRLSPGSATILQEIVRLGFLLQRNEIASRYAILLAENQMTMTADALQRVAQYCLEDGQTERAIQLYERALALLKKEGAHTQALGIHFRLLSTYQSHGEPKMAARHANEVAKMIGEPDKFELDGVVEQFTSGGLRSTFEKLGDVYLEADQPDKAAKMFAKAEEIDPSPEVHLIHLAKVLAARKDWAGAQGKLDQYLDADHRVSGQEPYALLLKVRQQMADSPEAARKEVIDRLRKLHDASPDFAPLAYFLTSLYAQQEDWDNVIAVAAPLIEEETDADALNNLCQAYIAKSDWPALVSLLATSLDGNYNLDTINEPLDKLIADQKKWDQLAAYLKSLTPAERSLNERIGIARLYQLASQGQTAWSWAESAFPDLDNQEEARLLMQFGLQAFRDQQEEVAEQAFRTAIKLGLPKSQTSLFYFYLATTLEMQGKTSDALRTAKRAALLDEESALLRSRIPWTLYHAGRTEEAVKEYQTLLEKFSDDFANQQTRQVIRDAKRLLSAIAGQRDDLPQATEWLEQVLDEFPDDTGAMNDLGYLWIDHEKNLGRGFAMIQKAVAKEPDNYAYLDSLGWAYYRLGQYEQAVSTLEHAAKLAESKDGTVLDHLGDAYLALGQKEKALASWKQASDVLQDDDDAEILSQVESKLKTHT